VRIDDEQAPGAGIEEAVRAVALSRRTFIGRGIAAGASATTLGALLSACGSGGSAGSGTAGAVGTPPKVPTGTFTVALAGAPTSLDPGRRLGIGAFYATEDLYDGLVTFNKEFTDVVGQLCESFEVSPDAREWTGKLRAGMTFHDGTPIDATAIRKNFEYFLKNAAYLFVPLPLQKIDDSKPDTIRLVWKTPYPYATRNLTLLKMQSPRAIAAGPKAIDAHPIGSGPFRFVSAGANTIELERFPGYWNKGLPHVERLRFVITPDPAARIAALRSGQINLATNLAPNDAVVVGSDPRTKTISKPSWFVTGFNFKLAAPAVHDLRVRQAVAYAIDREAIMKSLGRNQGKIADALMPPGSEGYTKMTPAYTYDPEKARALLKAIGKPVNLHMAVPAGDNSANFLISEAVGQAIVAQLQSVGIKATLDAITESVEQKERSELAPPHVAKLTGYTWFTGGPIIFAFMESDHNMQQAYPQQYARYKKLSDAMNAEPDLTKREALIAQIQQIHADVLPSIPLFVMPAVDGVTKDVQNYTPDIRNFGPNLDSVYFAS
jgi:peptide/nickel transport system substrate-binding protein